MQKAAAPRNGVGFHQVIISDIKCSLTTLSREVNEANWNKQADRQTAGQAEKNQVLRIYGLKIKTPKRIILQFQI